ncbi:hypothetical protein SAMN02910322_01860 [Bacteroides thetaiotaomicron]|nr:hypothetical protein SAMN02910322_01860 [Bacteroides thetaiotaomicron]
MGAWSYLRVKPVKYRAFFWYIAGSYGQGIHKKNHSKMYNKSIAITGSTIEKTTKYDRFREDKIRMELYRIILSFYNEGSHTFTCHLHTYLGLLAADTIIMLREADKCPEIIFSAVIPETPFPTDTDKVYRALYDDLMKQADKKETLLEKEGSGNALAGSHIICYYDDFSEGIGQVRASGIPYTNIRKMI